MIVFALAGLLGYFFGSPAPIIHYAPAENLETLDVAALNQARHTIDMAAYVLTDEPVIKALAAAARRGVVVRIVLDRSQLEERPETQPLMDLQGLRGVTLRVKRSRVLLHLKAWSADGRWLRVGSANFSRAGLVEQDNEMMVLDDRGAAARFEADFMRMFGEAASE